MTNIQIQYGNQIVLSVLSQVHPFLLEIEPRVSCALDKCCTNLGPQDLFRFFFFILGQNLIKLPRLALNSLSKKLLKLLSSCFAF